MSWIDVLVGMCIVSSIAVAWFWQVDRANLRVCEQCLKGWQESCEKLNEELSHKREAGITADRHCLEWIGKHDALRAHVNSIGTWLDGQISEARCRMDQAVEAKNWEVAAQCHVMLTTFERVRRPLAEEPAKIKVAKCEASDPECIGTITGGSHLGTPVKRVPGYGGTA